MSQIQLNNNMLHSFVMSLDADDITQIYKNYDPSKNKSSKIMTKYEKTLIIGQRAEQIANGAEPLIEIPEGVYDVREIAREELKQKASPFIIKRRYGNGHEYYKLEDLEIR
jgi:DNA-directed RNA polymerase subunit K/omega